MSYKSTAITAKKKANFKSVDLPLVLVLGFLEKITVLLERLLLLEPSNLEDARSLLCLGPDSPNGNVKYFISSV